jgi:hypothetical protein
MEFHVKNRKMTVEWPAEKLEGARFSTLKSDLFQMKRQRKDL